MRFALSPLLLGLALTPSLLSQSLPVGDVWEDYLRVLQVGGLAQAGGFTVRPLSRPAKITGSHPWMEATPPPALDPLGFPEPVEARFTEAQVRLIENTRYPWGQNDGAVWQGRGATLEVSFGGVLRVGPVVVEFRPSVIWNQNQSFPMAPVSGQGNSPYANPWHPTRIDLPQRFGPDPFWSFDPGQSSIRVEGYGLAFGFGTQNLWWGPGIRNGILMSNNAPGFPHAFLSTSRPLSVGIGKMEGQWIWGRLQQSDYAGPALKSTQRFITGLVLDFEPKAMEGLHLGLARVYYEYIPEGGLGTKDFLLPLQGFFKRQFSTAENPAGDDARDQMFSLFFRWAVPAGGFEAYGEWARNDHNANFRDFMVEPEHSQGATFGFQKVKELSGGRLLRILAETTTLEKNMTQTVRASPSYYTHHLVPQGYTQRGQVIGAGIGPGGRAQYLGFDVFTPRGSWGGFIQRQVINNDAYYTLAKANPGAYEYWRHDVLFSAGAKATRFWRGLELGGSLAWVKEYNRDFKYENDLANFNLNFSLRWRPVPR